MNIEADWREIRHHFARCFSCSVGSLDEDGSPRLTPVGSLVLLREPGRAYYLEKYVSGLRANLERDPRVSVMAVDQRVAFWLGALVRGAFARSPALRLKGRAGTRREATDEERARFLRRVRMVRWTRGHRLLWRRMSALRELHFDSVEIVRLGEMSRGYL